ncbi:MAG TPA: cytochrome P450 [Candidatus Binataceae bacterium]|nr:cytochrome P450 [Candidatus Binataceae bacterium]
MDYRYIDQSLSDPGFFVDHDPHPLWHQLRHEDPIHWTEGLVRPFWSVTRYDDIIAVVSEPNRFTSSQLISVPSSPEMEQLTPEMLGSGEMMLMTDPPLHAAMRRAFNRLMLPRAVGRFEGPGPELVREILDDALVRGECDFVVDVAARLPMAFICEIMGIPRTDWAAMFRWGNMIAGNEDAEYQVESGSPLETRQHGSFKIGEYCTEAALERRGNDGEDLLTVLGNARINGRLLTKRELAHNGLLYVGAGLETTRNAISAGLLALLDHPGELDRLIKDQSLMPTAVEEILRWSSPVTHFARVAMEDTELAGKQIRKGDRVALWFPSGNRDEEIFEDPYTFDIARTPNEHIAFSKGEHYCAGAHLARLELRLMLQALLKRTKQIALVGKVERLRSNFLAGIKHMAVRFTQSDEMQYSH